MVEARVGASQDPVAEGKQVESLDMPVRLRIRNFVENRVMAFGDPRLVGKGLTGSAAGRC